MQSIEQRQGQQWNRDGYVLLTERMTASEREDLARWVAETAAWPEQPGKWMKWYEQTERGRQLCRVEDFVPYHHELAGLLQGAKLAAALEFLLGEPAALFKEKINFKLPGGAGFQPHQDAPAFTAFGQSYHVTVMIAVDPSTRENGCLEVGTHCTAGASYRKLQTARSIGAGPPRRRGSRSRWLPATY